MMEQCMRWVGNVARMRKKNVCRVLVRKPEGKKHMKRLVVDGRIMLRS